MKNNPSSMEFAGGQSVGQTRVREDLPQSYGETEAFLLPRDPQWIFLLWDIAQSVRDFIRQEHGQDIFERGRAVARLYDVTDSGGEVSGASSF
ncbi:MAG: DUF4912 domain-containing protein, partial [Elusimicrobiota bacterium]|nr:DUF4912 domain-containing protein [Elusimicrobiota bacterium]